ncbi:hypothetical protein SFR_1218 [Streptomyces sp. FR-008]|nr:hypothetical protein SFR_1218 [Streptomyces sp. FR-008]
MRQDGPPVPGGTDGPSLRRRPTGAGPVRGRGR